MSKEKDFFKTCIGIVAGLEVKNESQAIAKEVVLSEVKNLQQENIQLSKEIDMWNKKYNDMFDENKQLQDNWNKLREYIKETKLKEFEKDYGKRYGKTFTQAETIICNMITNKMLELERGER